MLMVQTTSACNSSCVFCPLPGLRRKLPQGRMDDGLFRRIIEEAGGHPEVACINLFLMNEPLCDPSIVERIHFAKTHNRQAQISLWSNAVNLTPDLADCLLRSPLSSLGVSLHAQIPETYRKLTGRKDFYRVLRNLVHFAEQRLARRPDLTLTLRYVSACSMGADEKTELRTFWAEGEVTLDIDEGFLSRAGNLKAPGEPAEPRRWLAGCRALGGPKQAHVLYTGQVVLCCMDYQRVSMLGNCGETPLRDIWSGPSRRHVLEMLYGVRQAEPGFLCSRCELSVPATETPGDVASCATISASQ
jgi:hypothetical protein